MATYRVISLDLVTGTRIAQLDLRDLKFGQRLNGIGTIDGVLDLPAPITPAARVQGTVLNDAVDECRRLLVIERDGVVVADGIVWAAPWTTDEDGREVRKIKASSLWSYFRRRFITARSAFTAVDQLTIARTLITNAQAASGGNIIVTHNATLSGVTRDRTYESFELKRVAEAVEQLAGVEGGFDFAIDCHWDPATGALVRTLNMAYPRRGRSFSQTGHVFALGRNIIDLEWPTDGTETANRVWGIGAGEGKSMLIAAETDATQIQPLTSGGPGYPLLEDSFTNKDVTVRSTLSAQARARLTAQARPVVLPKITVAADVDPVLGSYITGDAARIIIPPNTSPRFPDGLDTYRRIVGWDVTVDDQGGESVDLLLGEEPVS
jgi:hypothetical protein